MKPALPRLLMMMLWFSGSIGCTAMGRMPAAQTESLEHTYQQKALALELRDKLQQALLAWRIAAGLEPDNALMPKIIANLTDTIDKRAQQSFANGLKYFGDGNYDQARHSFLRTVRLMPGHPEAIFYLKERLHRIGRREYVVQKGDSFSKVAVSIYQDSGKAYVIAYFNDLDPEKPLLTGTRLILPDLPQSPESLRKEKPTEKPLSAINQDPQDKAMEQARRVIREQEIESALEKTKWHLERKEFKTACGIMETIRAQAPAHSGVLPLLNQARHGWAKELIGQGQEALAIEILQIMDESYLDTRELLIEAKAKLNARAESYYRKGVKLFLNEDLEGAIRAWKTALTLNPNHPKAGGDMENALRLLEKWQDINAPQPEKSRSPSTSH